MVMPDYALKRLWCPYLGRHNFGWSRRLDANYHIYFIYI